MLATLKNLTLLLLVSGLSACASGKSGSGGKKDKQPLVSSAQTASTPFAPREQESAFVSYVPDSDASVAVWKSRVTMLAGSYPSSATLSLRLVPDAVIQTSNLQQVSPLVNFNAISTKGQLQRADLKKALRVETIVDRLVDGEQTVVIFIEHYGKENEARHMILPADVAVQVQEDQSRLVTFETRDTDFAFAIGVAKDGNLQPGFDQYEVLPADSTDLEFSAEGVTDEATEAKLTWTPSEGTRSGYRLEFASAPIETLGCAEGVDLAEADVTEFRQNFPKVFKDSYIATGLSENTTIYFQLCSLNERDPPDASSGLTGSYQLPRRAAATLTGTPSTVSGATSLSVTVGGTGIIEYQYALRSGPDAESCVGVTFSAWTDVATPIAATGLTEGNKRLCVLGKKSDKNVQLVPTTYAWAVDLTPPGAFTITALTSPTNNVTPTIAWSAATTAASYQIKVATNANCTTVVQSLTSTTTSKAATTLADGTYYLCIKALDGVGNGIDATNNGLSFVVDAIPPTFTSLVLANEVADGFLNAADHGLANDLVTLTAAGYTTATYALVDAAVTCNAGQTYGALPKEDAAAFGADGNYKVCVRLQDAATNTTYGTGATFAKDVAAPVFTSLALLNTAADGVVNSTENASSTALAGTLVASGHTTAAYRLVTSVTTCDDNLTYGAMPAANSTDFGADGSYQVCVELADAAGNPSAYGATSVFTLDTAGPAPFTISAPAAASTVTDVTPTVSWTDPGDAAQYTVKVDDASGCATPLASFTGVIGTSQTITALTDGVWYVCVVAYDAAGNLTPATNDSSSFTVSTGTWTAMTATSAPTARRDGTMVWDSSNAQAIVWGGLDGSGHTASGGAYNPAGNSWTSTDELDVDLPEERASHTAVWTGTTMIVWGGENGVSGPLQSGGIFTPGGRDLWTATTASGAPSARTKHTAVWTGSAMIVWGGDDGSTLENSGGIYDPVLDSWTPTDVLDGDLPTARQGHSAIWTGSKMIIWGGDDGSPTNTGAVFDPAGPNYWTPMTTTGAPVGRVGQVAIWTGTKLIVWGGYDGSGVRNDGAVYDLALDSWTPLSATDAPAARRDGVAAWDSVGSRLIVWGGDDGTGYLANGALYDPAGDAWTVPNMRMDAGATARAGASAVWSGTKMIVFGGHDASEKGVAASYAPP